MLAMIEGDAVAKKAARKPVATPEPDPSNRKPMIVQVRGSEEYKAWAEGLAEKEGFNLSMLVDRCFRKLAKEVGYPDPPKR